MPEVYNQFMDITGKLEKHYKDMQDVEFTIERGNLWMLQTRNGKRTAKSTVKIAVDMANEGLITKGRCRFAGDTRSTWMPSCTPNLMKTATKAAKTGILCQRRQRLAGCGSRSGLLRRR